MVKYSWMACTGCRCRLHLRFFVITRRKPSEQVWIRLENKGL